MKQRGNPFLPSPPWPLLRPHHRSRPRGSAARASMKPSPTRAGSASRLSHPQSEVIRAILVEGSPFLLHGLRCTHRPVGRPLSPAEGACFGPMVSDCSQVQMA